MHNQTVMQHILLAFLLVGDYLLLLSYARNSARGSRSLSLLALVLFLVTAAVGGGFVLIASRILGPAMVLMAVLLISVTAWLFTVFQFVSRNWREINKTVFILFLTYMLAVGYIAVFSRAERGRTEILLQFNSVSQALRRHSFEPMQHLFLNVVLFVPIGTLLPFVHSEELDFAAPVLATGFILTATIESVQLLFRLGQTDLEDLIANAAGALIGYWCFLLFRRFQRG